ncbi:MAG: hypothetical protein KC502_05895 [Myxococcales bacterium]|nr:hypothetical protein [Myxococcales bacterium]
MIVRAALIVAVTLCSATGFARAPTTVLPGHKVQLQRNSHALGLTGGYGGANGFAYRQYFGNSYVQMNLLPLVADQGDFLAVMVGASFARYLIVWNRPRSVSLMPSTTALRLVGQASTYFKRDKSPDGSFEQAPCTGVSCNSDLKTSATTENITSVGAGVGFEFGGLLRNGFSMSLDVLLTSVWDEVGFDMLVPLPYASVMYSW